ncbi:MAG: hypothetical protein Q8Q42_01835 [Nanoarchaeota archaeon]|nr:hypothetical protein [Nanoarchaeota archaeon]
MAARRKARKRASAKKSTARRRTTSRRVSKPSVSAGAATTVAKKSKSHDLAAMYMSILIVGVAGIILLVAKPTPSMQKIIGVLLVVLGLWGLMMKK